jgi:hypothetical protein
VDNSKKPINEQPTLESNKSKRDFSRAYEELHRKNFFLLTVWNSLDVKIGVFLGFTVLILFGLIFNIAVLKSITLSTNPFIFTLDCAECWLFWLGLFFFLLVIGIGLHGLYIRTFEDIDTVKETYTFMHDKAISPEVFMERLSEVLKDSIEGYEDTEEGKIAFHPGNEEIVELKARAVTRMLYSFVLGTAFFLIWMLIFILIPH